MDTPPAPATGSTDSWNTGYGERDDVEMDNRWEQESDEILTVPKLEPFEDELRLSDFTAAPAPSASLPAPSTEQPATQAKQKRPRGRPRKHPLPPAPGQGKITKGRSKTGCITCRKRKKKCDEAKPRCMNCEKNAVVCEGYHEKQIWKSGKERAEEERLRRESLPVITMQPIFHGVETTEDMIFWKHYITQLSNVLTVESEAKNAFKDIILQLANQHQGLMHSILSLSSKHIDLDTPYGAKLLAENPQSSRQLMEERSQYHHDRAIERLYGDMNIPLDKHDPEYNTVLYARYGQMLCLLLQTRAEGNPRAEHRVHLKGYQKLIREYPPEDPAFHTFITEFFQYHIYADDLFWHPGTRSERLTSTEWASWPIHPPRLIGVADGLFEYLVEISGMRNKIRENMIHRVDPLVDYTSLYRAAEIDADLRDWTPHWPVGDSRDRVALLYKQMIWVYLFRTIYPPSPPSMRRSTFSTLPAVAVPLEPPRRASMASSFPAVKTPINGFHTPHSNPSSRNPSRTSSMHERDCRAPGEAPRSSSPPPPSRRLAYHDQRITTAVEESLDILETFKPSDPTQTLLLIPCLLIGTACFEVSQRERIRTAIKAVRGYTGLRNCDRVSEVLEAVWDKMEDGEWQAVWDWQSLARRMGLDFMCA
ncbi:fungal-specific transcription factor domain-containing protein [Mariannaea sp. PMI_226]|nr:fungal-specific transcription factor domain-containing protein [Mariannaea sp. PMI_226]